MRPDVCVCACERDPVSLCQEVRMVRTRATTVSFSHRMPTSPRSMLFVLAPIAASWPLEGLTASSISGTLWEVRVPPLWANLVLSLQTPPSTCSLVGKGLGSVCVSSHVTFLRAVAKWPLGKSSGPSLPALGVQACRMGRAELRWSLFGEVGVPYP